MRATAIVSSVLLSASLVAGCGGDGGSSSGSGAYCKDLKAAKADFDTFNSSSPDFEKLDDAFQTMHDLSDGAPPEVADEWKTLDGALTSMEKTLADAGLEVSDLGALATGGLPEGVTAEEMQSLFPKLQELSSEKVEKAGDKIQKHAKDECGVDLEG